MWADAVQWGLVSAGSLHTILAAAPEVGARAWGQETCVLSTCWERRAAFRKTCKMAIPAMWVRVSGEPEFLLLPVSTPGSRKQVGV